MAKEKMIIKKNNFYTQPWFLILVFLIIGIALFLNFNNNKTVSDPVLDSFAKCLTQKGVKMYGAYWCPHCKNQKELFGSSFKYINYVECDLGGRQNPECVKAGIKGYPTWIYNNEKKSGELSFSELSEWTGCELNLNQT